KLKEVDPQEAEKIHPNNTIRVLRALEIYRQTGTTKTQLISSGTYKQGEFDFVCFCLAPAREVLYERINRRVDEMMADGLLEEVKGLLADGLRDALRQAKVIGYDELLDYLEGKYPLAEAVAMIKQHTRRYAKRQMTWFRTQMACPMFSSADVLKPALAAALEVWTSGPEKG
ncbi:MAG: tRNA (adenosine(37)-N6)-dimethylallyltransferase MiaA, partial [Candidatus Zixiibacteriota bacterium]